MLNVSKIFVAHYKKLVDRKEYITNQLVGHGIDINWVEWVTDYDTDEWDVELIQQEHPYLFDGSGIHCNIIRNTLNMPEVSLNLKHRYIMSSVVENEIPDALVFEDDCILQDNFIERFNTYKRQLPDDWDLIFIGGDNQVSENIVGGVNVYERKGFHSSRGTFCYFISLGGARKMNEMMQKINDPTDWYFNHMIETRKINNYWAEPPLVLHNYDFPSILHADQEKYYENYPEGNR